MSLQATIDASRSPAMPHPLVASLRAELQDLVVQADAHPVFKALADGSATRDLYAAFLTETRHYIAETYPTLQAAGRRLQGLGRQETFVAVFAEKAAEEKGHDRLIDRDLETLGIDVAAALATGPGRWVQAYKAWISATTAGKHPLAFLGTAYMLEGLGVQRAGVVSRALKAAGRIEAITDALTFLDVHAEADIGHVEELETTLASLDDGIDAGAITVTAGATRVFYLGMLDEIGDAVGLPSRLS